jgi:hypothetical protein
MQCCRCCAASHFPVEELAALNCIHVTAEGRGAESIAALSGAPTQDATGTTSNETTGTNWTSAPTAPLQRIPQLHTLCVVDILQTTLRGFSRHYTKGNVSIETAVEQDPPSERGLPERGGGGGPSIRLPTVRQ